ncbi:MAG: sensor domain-containing diguanylate cyclase, partial [Hyphomicrobiales bacterium]
MEIDLNLHEQLIMYQLMSDAKDDIIIKTDCDGFIRYASPSSGQIERLLRNGQPGPHVLDLVDEPFKPAIAAALSTALHDANSREWTRFRSHLADDAGDWFTIRLAALRDEQGKISGTLGILRDQREVKHLEEQLFRAELTDPLTGLTNRLAWMEMLKHLIDTGSPACLALIDIDHFKAINLHYGVSSGDKVLIAFADFLRNQMPDGISISRVGGSRFGMFFPGWSVDQTESTCREIVDVLANLRCTDWQHRFSLTASVGIASLSGDIDATVKTVETALRLARAKGGNTVTIDQK